MRERVDIDQFRRQPHESTVSEDDSLATKVRKLRSRGLSAEKIADKLYLGRDLYSGETVRDQHWQKLKREIDAICGGMECQ